jgi:uncharacterized Ntn-hydrolase superfamily protein
MATSVLSSRIASNEDVEDIRGDRSDDPLEELSRLVDGAKRRLVSPIGEQA